VIGQRGKGRTGRSGFDLTVLLPTHDPDQAILFGDWTPRGILEICEKSVYTFR
jgi:hypothetical protein